MGTGIKYHSYYQIILFLEDDLSGKIPVLKKMQIGWLGPACPGPAAGRMN
jgi:hypothetical protein